MFQNLPLPGAQEIRESGSGVIPCIVTKNDGFCTTKFSSERWSTVVPQERAVLASVYRLPWKCSVVQYYPIIVIRHDEHHLHSTLHWQLKLTIEALRSRS